MKVIEKWYSWKFLNLDFTIKVRFRGNERNVEL